MVIFLHQVISGFFLQLYTTTINRGK